MDDDLEAGARQLPTAPPLYLLTTIDPDIAMIALENYIVATTDRAQRGRAIRALADFMAGGRGTTAPRL